jgi:hypothetical protein
MRFWQRKGKNVLFLKKKNQKKLFALASEVDAPPSQTDKSLLLLFFRKEDFLAFWGRPQER